MSTLIAQPGSAASDPPVLGISVDGVWCHLAFANERHLRHDFDSLWSAIAGALGAELGA